MSEIVIVGAARTPVGAYQGGLKDVAAVDLGVVAVKAALAQAGVPADQIDTLIFGNVLQGGVGQNPAKQVAVNAGLAETTDATTVNKVCASGLKAVGLAANELRNGDATFVVAGGMENMSRAPMYLSRTLGYGHQQLSDSIVLDGLTDVYSQKHMGLATDALAQKLGISREDADAYAVQSFQKAAEAWKNGAFADEIAPVTVKTRKGDVTVAEDEQYKKVIYEKVPSLRPVFSKDGVNTAANSSALNDGASALILTTAETAQKHNLKPLARVLGFADGACHPEDFGAAPSVSLPKALAKAGKSVSDIDLFEINEAFAAVALANAKKLSIDPSKINVKGGAVALGHALGNSGSRILVTLVHELASGKVGAAGICNGGGGSSSIVIERI